jgi:hypothetical protein
MHPPMDETSERLRMLLCRLGDEIRARLIAARTEPVASDFATVAAVTAADTIYAIDRVSESAIVGWFHANWPRELPVEVVMEGHEADAALTFPIGTPVSETEWKCILDPIDGTRCIMYDKRAAWALAAVAPQRGAANRLGDIVVAAMTELPTSKQGFADQFSAIRGRGPGGVRGERIALDSGERRPIPARPSQACDFGHGFASFVKFFPEGKGITARLEEQLWERLVGLGLSASPVVFDDQYLSTGGQIHELLVGHDRLVADLRPLILGRLGFGSSLTCHPYDICTALVLEEAGGIVEAPDGRALEAPLDTTSAVAWVGYANPRLAALARPHLSVVLRENGLMP